MRTVAFLVAATAAAMVTVACTASPPPPVHVSAGRDVVAGQNRINRYFHKDVVPKLKGCWSRLQGTGTIDIEFAYKRAGRAWASDTLRVAESTLRADQVPVAQQCMQDATKGTAFLVEDDDGDATELVVDWRWPVPWPEDITPVALQAGGVIWGDCGLGKLAKCQDCLVDKKTKKLTCKSACVGYKTCSANADGNGCTMSQACYSGFANGTVGGAVIY